MVWHRLRSAKLNSTPMLRLNQYASAHVYRYLVFRHIYELEHQQASVLYINLPILLAAQVPATREAVKLEGWRYAIERDLDEESGT